MTVIFAGYLKGRATVCQLTNYEDPVVGEVYGAAKSEFEWYWQKPDNLVPNIGCFARGYVLTDPDSLAGRQKLFELLTQRKPLKAILGKNEAIIDAAASNPATAGAIGHSMVMSALKPDLSVITYNSTRSPHSTYYVSDTVDVVDQIATMPGEIALEAPEPGRPVYKQGPCPCGNGLRYKKCHGRQKWKVNPSVGFGIRSSPN